MGKSDKFWWYLGGAAALILLITMSRPAYNIITDWLIPYFEGFLPTPKWDNKQYTWGYGTRAPGPTGTITREKALSDMRAYVLGDYTYLKPHISRNLTPAQWAAYLSFSFNEGKGAAAKLFTDINAGNDNVLEDHWKEYVYSGGSLNQDLIDRRSTEWSLWEGSTTA